MIRQRTIDEVRDRADIVDVVSRYVELRRAGANFKALCPFHQEKTPSFVVSPERQIFHCFGCGKGGNVFSFLMEIEGVSFPEAVRSLARSYGVKVEAERIPEEVRTRNDSLFRANEFAARWYHEHLLRSREGEEARRYLLSRGIGRDLWSDFRLGFALKSRDALFRAAREAGILAEILKEAGLVMAREGRYIDYFRSRVVFPICSPSARVVAFGGRRLGGGEPKYLNSPESPIFQKKRSFFGLNLAREAMRSAGKVVLVEGYTDCISLRGAGWPNTVATCGTALTREQASMLRRMTRRVVMVPDADEAGTRAAISAGAVLLGAGLEVQVAQLERGLDPDSAVRRMGQGRFAVLIDSAMDYFDFLKYIIKKDSLSLLQRQDLIQRLVDGVAGLGDRLRREMILADAARAFGVDPESLRERVGRRGRGGGEGRKGRGKGDRRTDLEKMVLKMLMMGEASWGRQMLDIDDFTQEDCRQFYKLLDSALERHIDLRSSEFHKLAEQAGLASLAAEIALIPIPPGNFKQLARDTVKRVKSLKLRDELEMLKEELRKLPEGSREAVAVAEYYARLKKALSEL